MAKKNFYAITVGWRPGIYREWYGPDGAEAASSGYPGDTHPGFSSLQEATSYFFGILGRQPFDRQWYEIAPYKLVERISVETVSENDIIRAEVGQIKGGFQEKEETSQMGLVICSQDIGRWGEEFALCQLLYEKAATFVEEIKIEIQNNHYILVGEGKILARITWLNKLKETNQSPDIKMEENGVASEYEVKATRSNNLGDFLLTPSEWRRAKELGENYILLRVCQAGTKDAKVYKIPNPQKRYLDGVLILDGLDISDKLAEDTPKVPMKLSELITKIQLEQGNKQESLSKPQRYYEGIGRRKEATARVRITRDGYRLFLINHKPAKQYLNRLGDYQKAKSPSDQVGESTDYSIYVVVKGGGVSSQTEAIRLGLARALLKLNPGIKPEFRKKGFLTCDARVKERKKPGLKRARKAPTYTKR